MTIFADDRHLTPVGRWLKRTLRRIGALVKSTIAKQ